MTINEAFVQFLGSNEFKEIAKNKDPKGAKFRMYLSRFKNGKLKMGAMVEALIANNYEVKANKVRKILSLVPFFWLLTT